MFFFCFSAGIKLTYIQFMKIDFGSKVCSESKLQLKSIQNVIFHLLEIFQHFQTMCSCGSCHTLLIFQLRIFLGKKISKKNLQVERSTKCGRNHMNTWFSNAEKSVASDKSHFGLTSNEACSGCKLLIQNRFS